MVCLHGSSGHRTFLYQSDQITMTATKKQVICANYHLGVCYFCGKVKAVKLHGLERFFISVHFHFATIFPQTSVKMPFVKNKLYFQTSLQQLSEKYNRLSLRGAKGKSHSAAFTFCLQVITFNLKWFFFFFFPTRVQTLQLWSECACVLLLWATTFGSFSEKRWGYCFLFLISKLLQLEVTQRAINNHLKNMMEMSNVIASVAIWMCYIMILAPR